MRHKRCSMCNLLYLGLVGTIAQSAEFPCQRNRARLNIPILVLDAELAQPQCKTDFASRGLRR